MMLRMRKVKARFSYSENCPAPFEHCRPELNQILDSTYSGLGLKMSLKGKKCKPQPKNIVKYIGLNYIEHYTNVANLYKVHPDSE